MSERPARFFCKHGTPRATFEVSGPERASWLNGLLTCNVMTCTPEQAVWGLALNRTGKIQGVCWVVAAKQSLLVGVATASAPELLESLDRMLVMEDAEIVDASERFRWGLLLDPEVAMPAVVASGQLDLAGLGERAIVWEVDSPPSVTAPELDERSWTQLRLERGLPQFGVDFDGSARPHEAALDRRAVDWSKGCYLGQEVVCMQDMRGKVTRSVVRLGVASPSGVAVGAPVVDDAGQQLGVITSAAYSDRAGRWLSMAQLPLAKIPSPMFVQQGSEKLPAELVTESF